MYAPDISTFVFNAVIRASSSNTPWLAIWRQSWQQDCLRMQWNNSFSSKKKALLPSRASRPLWRSELSAVSWTHAGSQSWFCTLWMNWVTKAFKKHKTEKKTFSQTISSHDSAQAKWVPQVCFGLWLTAFFLIWKRLNLWFGLAGKASIGVF